MFTSKRPKQIFLNNLKYIYLIRVFVTCLALPFPLTLTCPVKDSAFPCLLKTTCSALLQHLRHPGQTQRQPGSIISTQFPVHQYKNFIVRALVLNPSCIHEIMRYKNKQNNTRSIKNLGKHCLNSEKLISSHNSKTYL